MAEIKLIFYRQFKKKRAKEKVLECSTWPCWEGMMRFTESQEEKMEVDLVERRGENTLLIRLSERSMNNKEVIFLPRSILFYLYLSLSQKREYNRNISSHNCPL